MDLFKKKFFVLFLLVAITVSSVWAPPTAHAGGVLGFIADVFTVGLVSVTLAIISPVLIIGGSFSNLTGNLGTIIVASTFTGGDPLLSAVACYAGFICGVGSSGGVSVAIVSSATNSCRYGQSIHFYIPQLNVNNSCIPDTSFNEADRSIAIYRFTIPASSDQATLNDWFINQIKNEAGNGFTLYDTLNSERTYMGSIYHYGPDNTSKIIITAKASTFCIGNTCTFVDQTIPGNSYVAYVAKILGDYYTGSTPALDGIAGCSILYDTSEGGGSYLGPDCPSCSVPGANKFLNKDNAVDVIFPSIDYHTIGNAIVGPLKTATPYCRVDGVCGSAINGASLTSAPTMGLCEPDKGTPTTVTGSGPWNWSCVGNAPTVRSYQCPSYNNTAGTVFACGAPYTCNGQIQEGESTCIGSDHGDSCGAYHTYDCVDVTPAPGAKDDCYALLAGQPTQPCSGSTLRNEVPTSPSDVQPKVSPRGKYSVTRFGTSYCFDNSGDLEYFAPLGSPDEFDLFKNNFGTGNRFPALNLISN
ncbi:MAG: hypothetical protein WCS97_01125 [Candidatus Paceibacterota bacterium]|jgi:hypothetical protein